MIYLVVYSFLFKYNENQIKVKEIGSFLFVSKKAKQFVFFKDELNLSYLLKDAESYEKGKLEVH